jgi:hypothetical protein
LMRLPRCEQAQTGIHPIRTVDLGMWAMGRKINALFRRLWWA